MSESSELTWEVIEPLIAVFGDEAPIVPMSIEDLVRRNPEIDRLWECVRCCDE